MPLSGERPMLTSFSPMASSCRIEFSNFSTSFDIATPPSRCFFGSFEPPPDARNCAHRLRRAPNQDGRDVVAAARLIGELDKALGGFLSLLVFRLDQGSRNLRVRKVARQPVGAEKNRVALED